MFKSCAKWPSDVFTDCRGGHISVDFHRTAEEAEAVARMLMRHGFGGRGRKPIRTWIEPDDSPNLERCDFDDECDHCNSPSGGSYAKMVRVPMENPEADFYICGRCASSRGWLPIPELARPPAPGGSAPSALLDSALTREK